MKSYDFIEMYKEKNNLPSDYKASQKLGISRQAISNYKNGRPLDEDLALPIAESLEIEPSEILYIINSEKGKTVEIRKAWKMLSKLSSQKGYSLPNQLILNAFIFWVAGYCILCKIANVAKRLPYGVSPNYLVLA